MNRTPLMEECLECFNTCYKQEIRDVIDVGVQWGTPFLMEAYPRATHHLIEPVKQYHPQIEEIYSSQNIEYNLLPIAFSNKVGCLWLHEYDYDSVGRVSHSQIRTQRVESEYLMNVSEVQVKRLDDVYADKLKELSFIVKIDVDGLEKAIILGGERTIKSAACVIVEAPLMYLRERLGLLESFGFTLWDMVDPAYYYGQLHQVDLIMLNNLVRECDIDFRPWDKNEGALLRSEWQGGREIIG